MSTRGHAPPRRRAAASLPARRRRRQLRPTREPRAGGAPSSARASSSPLEFTLPLFEKRRQRLGVVVGLLANGLKRRAYLKVFREVLLLCELEQSLRIPYCLRGLCSDSGGQFFGAGQQLFRLSYVKHYANGFRFLGFDDTAGEREFGGSLIAHQPLQ